jgi:hypothetical protein
MSQEEKNISAGLTYNGLAVSASLDKVFLAISGSLPVRYPPLPVAY